MKKIVFSVVFSLLATATWAQNANRCGNVHILEQINAQNPGFSEQRAQRLFADQQIAEQLSAAQQKGSAAQNPIPVVFHIVVTPSQYFQMGNDTGVIRRVNSQLAVLNADYSATNTDLNRVPTPFVSLIGNTGLQFRLASGTNANTIAPGIEVRQISNSVSFSSGDGFADAKRYANGGLDSWDYTKQLNIWVVNTDNGILGLCIPPQYVGFSVNGHTVTTGDLGVVVSYSAFGSRAFNNQYFYPGSNDKGRTLTHEVGHYFELEHIWMDVGCGNDDGIADTPPQDDATYCTPNCPTFPIYDACSPSGNGIMFMNYMDYVDDAAMMLFTNGQAQRIQFYTSPGQESYSLTQQPLGVSTTETTGNKIIIAPNPTNGIFRIENNSTTALSHISLLDQTGRVVYRAADLNPQESRVVDVSSFAKGLYFLQATNANQTFTQKIVLQ